jgi:hypothetical protein
VIITGAEHDCQKWSLIVSTRKKLIDTFPHFYQPLPCTQLVAGTSRVTKS